MLGLFYFKQISFVLVILTDPNTIFIFKMEKQAEKF